MSVFLGLVIYRPTRGILRTLPRQQIMATDNRLYEQLLLLTTLCVALSRAQQPVCPQQGATTITQLELVPRPEGIANLRCDFNVPPDPTHTDTGFLYIAWVIDTTSQLYTHLYDPDDINDAGVIQPGYEDLVLRVIDNFNNLGRSPGYSIITLNVRLAIKNEFKCEVLLRNHQYCVDTTRIAFQEPDMILEADGDEYCRNNGGYCGKIPSKDHNITCRVINSESNPPTMTLKVNGEIISSGPPDVTINADRYYDGVITASYNVSENATSTCEVTDTRGTYILASSQLDSCNPNPCLNGGNCSATSNKTFICDCPPRWTGPTCESSPGPCMPDPCQNGGTCMRTSDVTFICVCPPEWTGDRCGSPLPCPIVMVVIFVLLAAALLLAAVIICKGREKGLFLIWPISLIVIPALLLVADLVPAALICKRREKGLFLIWPISLIVISALLLVAALVPAALICKRREIDPFQNWVIALIVISALLLVVALVLVALAICKRRGLLNDCQGCPWPLHICDAPKHNDKDETYAAGDTTGAPENDTSRMEHAEDGNHVYTSLDQSAAANDKETRPANSHVNPTYNVSIDEP